MVVNINEKQITKAMLNFKKIGQVLFPVHIVRATDTKI